MSRATRPDRRVAAVGGVRVAVDAAELAEVAPVGAVAWVPCRDPALLGVALHRDRPVPVVDGRRRLGVGAAGQPPWLCVFVRTSVGEVAVPVDGVPGLEPESEARPAQAPCVALTAIPIAGGAEDGPRAAH